MTDRPDIPEEAVEAAAEAMWNEREFRDPTGDEPEGWCPPGHDVRQEPPREPSRREAEERRDSSANSSERDKWTGVIEGLDCALGWITTAAKQDESSDCQSTPELLGEERTRTLEAALRFYADHRNYEDGDNEEIPGFGEADVNDDRIWTADGGYTARVALGIQESDKYNEFAEKRIPAEVRDAVHTALAQPVPESPGDSGEGRKTYRCPECGREARDGKPIHRPDCSKPDAVPATVGLQPPAGLPLFRCPTHGLIQPERWEPDCVGEHTHCPVPVEGGKCRELLDETHVAFASPEISSKDRKKLEER